MKDRPATERTVLAGFAATSVMTMLMYTGPIMGMPRMDIAGMLGTMFGGWWAGMLMHFVNGTIIFPLVYALALYRFLPGAPWLKGMIWGAVLWFLAQTMVMPMMCMGVFSSGTPAPAASVMGSLIGHLLYGAVLGAAAGAVESGAQHPAYSGTLRKAG